jgi:hypothetical protein
MNKLLTLTAVIGLLSAATAQAKAVDEQPAGQHREWTATPHQATAIGNAMFRIEPNLGTPAAQQGAEPAAKRVSPVLFGEFPATVHQASLGLDQAGGS